jgi:hypothetical protein
MQIVGLSLLSLGVLGLLVMAGHIAWEAARDLRYVSRLDDWAEDVPPWQ